MSKIYTDKEVDQIVKKRLERAKKVYNAEIYKAKENTEKTVTAKYDGKLAELNEKILQQKKLIDYYKLLEKARALLEDNGVSISETLLKKLFSISAANREQPKTLKD